MNDNKFINDIPVERSKVPNDNFPVITVYTKSINIINREETDYRDALDIVNINIIVIHITFNKHTSDKHLINLHSINNFQKFQK